MRAWSLSRFTASPNPRSSLSAEAKARGESLQEYLLDVLDREVRDIENRRFLAQWTADSLEDAARRVDQTMIIAH
jgi:hypothetical protein